MPRVKPKLIMLRGLPASGKTTYSKKLVDEGYVRVCKEDLRNMMFFGDLENCVDGGIPYWRGKNAKLGKYVMAFAIKTALRMGYNVVIDGSNLTKGYERRYGQFAKGLAKLEVYDMGVPVETCVERNRERRNVTVSDETYVKLVDSLKRKAVNKNGRPTES